MKKQTVNLYTKDEINTIIQMLNSIEEFSNCKNINSMKAECVACDKRAIKATVKELKSILKGNSYLNS